MTDSAFDVVELELQQRQSHHVVDRNIPNGRNTNEPLMRASCVQQGPKVFRIAFRPHPFGLLSSVDFKARFIMLVEYHQTTCDV